MSSRRLSTVLFSVLAVAFSLNAVGGHGAIASSPVDARIDFNAGPPPGWKAFDPALAPAPGAREHKVTWDMTETVLEIAPGVTQELWTFNNQVPGPVLRGRVGDVFTVTIVNKGRVPHSVDFHAS